VRDWSEAIRLAVLAGKHAKNTRHPPCPRCVDLQDPRMRVGRTHDDGIGLPRHVEVVGEPSLAGQQPLILLAADRPADRADRGDRVNVDRVVHSLASGSYSPSSIRV